MDISLTRDELNYKWRDVFGIKYRHKLTKQIFSPGRYKIVMYAGKTVSNDNLGIRQNQIVYKLKLEPNPTDIMILLKDTKCLFFFRENLKLIKKLHKSILPLFDMWTVFVDFMIFLL